jgi:long-subunit fatty acid transport protein
VNGTTQSGVTHPMAKDQTRTSFSAKFQLGDFDIGLTSFGSGAIQMDGQNAAAGLSVVPSADVKLDTQAIMGRYSFNDNWSTTVGLRQIKLKPSTVTTLAAEYAIDSTSKTGMVYGVAYEIPKYALKIEVLQSEAITMGLTGTATNANFSSPFDLAATAEVKIPEATTLKVETGIAENTLLMISAHRVKWKSSQIVVDVAGVPNIPGVIASDSLDTGSNFSNTTSYSVGLGRKLSESTAVSLTYSWEDGAGAAATSPFTMSNGSKTLSAGVKHKIDAFTISAGVSYTKVGDVEMTHISGLSASYAGNSVTAFGLKLGYNF